MKKFATFALLILVLAACKKPEDDNSNEFSEYIVGQWNIDELEADITTDILGNPVQIPAEAISLNGFYQFNSDQTFKYMVDTDMEIIIPGIGIDTIPYKDEQEGTYEIINDNDIRLNSQGGSTIFEVKSKSPSTIIGDINEEIDTMALKLDLEIEMILRK